MKGRSKDAFFGGCPICTVFATLLLLLLQANHCTGDVLPSYASGSELSKIHFVAKLQVGTLTKKLKLAIDRSSSDLRLAVPLSRSLSRSFVDLNGGSDIVYIGQEEILFKVVYDPSAASNFGCSDCMGVLGLGSASPVWLHFQEAIYTAGAIYFDESLPSFDSSSRGSKNVECQLFTPQICVTTGSVLGKVVNVVFGMDELSQTLLPGDIFDQYVGIKSLSSDISDWDDLVIKFPDLAKGKAFTSASAGKIVIRNNHIVSRSSNGNRHLTIAKSPDPSTVFLGRSANLDYMVKLNRLEKKLKIADYDVDETYSTVGLFVGILLSLVYHRWKTIPDGSWESIGYRAPEKIFTYVIVIVGSVGVYGVEEYQSALKPFEEVNIYVGVVIVGMVCWSFLVVLAYFEWIRNVFGLVRYKIPVPLPPSSKLPPLSGRPASFVRIEPVHGDINLEKDLELGMKKIQSREVRAKQKSKLSREINAKADGRGKYARDKQSNKRSTEWAHPRRRTTTSHSALTTVILQSISDGITKLANVGRRVFGEERSSLTANGAAKRDSSKSAQNDRPLLVKGNSVYFNPRLWAIATVSVETAVITAIWVVLLENRPESLWGYISAVVFLYLLFDYLQHFIVIMSLKNGRLSFFWWLFIFFLFGLILASFYIGQKYVVGPTLEQLVQTTDTLRIFVACLIYITVVYLAIWTASNTLLLYKKNVDAIIANIQKEKQTLDLLQ